MFKSKRPGFVSIKLNHIPKGLLPLGPAVYIIEDEEKNKIYVGSTKNISDRMRSHERRLREDKHENRNIQALYNAGSDFTIHIKTTTDRDKAYELEQETIDSYKCSGVLLNISTEDVRMSRKGVPNSPEVREKIRQHRLGTSIPDEVKKKISNALKGRKKPEGFGEHLSKVNLNHPRREELNKALSENRMSGDNPYAKAVIIDGVEYGSGNEASRVLGIPRSTLEKRIKSNKPEYSNYKQK